MKNIIINQFNSMQVSDHLGSFLPAKITINLCWCHLDAQAGLLAGFRGRLSEDQLSLPKKCLNLRSVHHLRLD